LTEVVSNRRVSILAAAGALSILWTVFVVPADKPWTGLMWLGTLAFLLASSVALVLGAARPAALATRARPADEGRRR
jgi:hypothetical protein